MELQGELGQRNENAISTSIEYNKVMEGKDHITLPYIVDDKIIENIVNKVD